MGAGPRVGDRARCDVAESTRRRLERDGQDVRTLHLVPMLRRYEAMLGD